MRRNLQNRNCFMTQTPPLLSDYVTNPLELVPNKACMFKDLEGGFPGGTSGKEPACQSSRCKRHRFDPWVGKIPGEEQGNPLQYSCRENLMDRGAWLAIVHGVAESQTWLKWLSTHALEGPSGLCYSHQGTGIQFSSKAKESSPVNQRTDSASRIVTDTGSSERPWAGLFYQPEREWSSHGSGSSSHGSGAVLPLPSAVHSSRHHLHLRCCAQRFCTRLAQAEVPGTAFLHTVRHHDLELRHYTQLLSTQSRHSSSGWGEGHRVLCWVVNLRYEVQDLCTRPP